MPSKKTVIVVGAGASVEACLPTSAKLKERIAQLLDIRFGRFGTEKISGDDLITEALRKIQQDSKAPDINQYLHAGWDIRDGLWQAPSIDSFIEARQGDKKIELCGKLAIVRAILEAEKKSPLYIDPSTRLHESNFKSVEDTWLNAFWKRLSENCQAEGLEDRFSSIVLIIFNYDRCVEHFLYHSIQNYFGLSEDDAAALVNTIEIFHPYGTVGSLPWTGGPAQMAFGAEPTTNELVTLAEQIKTFTEGTDPKESEVEAIRNHVTDPDTLIFLGFAYHPQNIDLLRRPANEPHLDRNVLTKCYGTAYEISEADCVEVESRIKGLISGSVDTTIKNVTCRDFFDMYSLTLSFVR